MQNGDEELGLKIGEIIHFLKAFADDLTIVTPNEVKMGKAWRRMQEAFSWCGLSENAKKCRYLVFNGKSFVEQEGGVDIDGKNIPCGIKEKSVFLGSQDPLKTLSSRLLPRLIISMQLLL